MTLHSYTIQKTHKRVKNKIKRNQGHGRKSETFARDWTDAYNLHTTCNDASGGGLVKTDDIMNGHISKYSKTWLPLPGGYNLELSLM